MELHKILNDREMKECLLLVFANKQDLPDGTSHRPLLHMWQLRVVELIILLVSPFSSFSFLIVRLTSCSSPPYNLIHPTTAMTPTEVTEKLGLLRMKDRSWYCHPSNALDGDGLFEGTNSIHSLIRTFASD